MSVSGLRLAANGLRELRLHLCQKSSASAGVRAFINNSYVSLKKENRDFPILIRECSGIQPRVWARYGQGVEKSISLEDMSEDRVASVIRELAAARGV